MKVSELTGAALDWAVAKCENPALTLDTFSSEWERYNCAASIDWAQAGPIIEREGITVGKRYVPKFLPKNSTPVVDWTAQYFESPHSALEVHRQFGPTPLIAAMRCFVASRLGDDIEVPLELK